MANVPITSLPEATAPSTNDYLILQGENTQRIKWSALLDKLYPVGCIYQSASSTSPASFWGGTWERIAQNRVLMGASNTHLAGTTAEAGLPNIVGNFAMDAGGPWQKIASATGAFYSATGSGAPAVTGDVDTNVPISIRFDASKSNAVFGSSETVQPPAYFVYIWKRTA